MAKKKKVSRKSKTKKLHEKHDLQHYTMVLYVASVGMSILFMLGAYTTATGLATATGGLDVDVAIDSISEVELYAGNGWQQCTYLCAGKGKNAIVSSLDGEIVENSAEITGEWTCLCS
tara:strand:- start:22 stop:375 length:354 start_codon:yes stop_codon:yes gene_type:complete